MNCLDEWRMRRRMKQYSDGYEFAAGELLRGKPVTQVDAMIMNSDFSHDLCAHPFDIGMTEAVRDWEQRKLP